MKIAGINIILLLLLKHFQTPSGFNNFYVDTMAIVTLFRIIELALTILHS